MSDRLDSCHCAGETAGCQACKDYQEPCDVVRAHKERGVKMPLCAYCLKYEMRAPCKDRQCKACKSVPLLLPTELAGLAPSTNDLGKVFEPLKMPGNPSGALEALEKVAQALEEAAELVRRAVVLVSTPLQEQGGSSNDAAPPGLSGGHKRNTAERLEHDMNVAAATVARVEEQAAQQQAAPVQAGHVVAPGQAEHAAPVQDEHEAAPEQAVQVRNAPVQAVPETKSDAASGSGNMQKSWEEAGWIKKGWLGW
jgi:hypothetical protein